MTNIDISLLATVIGGTHKEQKPEKPKGNPSNVNTTNGNAVPRAFGGTGWDARGGALRGGGGASMGIPTGQVRVMR